MIRLLELDDVSMAFGGLKVSQHVSFGLAAGERGALIGPNGAGKTTLVNLMTGALRPTSGRVLLQGEDVTDRGIAHRVRCGLARTFQITRLFTSLTVEENVALPIMQRLGFARHVHFPALGDPRIRSEVADILSLLGLERKAREPVNHLAYGEQRLLEIAIAFALRPKVLLLDEPAAGVPHDEVHRVLEAINALPPDIAILMIEHDMDLVFRFATTVLVLANGSLIFQGLPDDVARNDEVRTAYLGSYANAGSIA